jgi:hypothetical protein
MSHLLGFVSFAKTAMNAAKNPVVGSSLAQNT